MEALKFQEAEGVSATANAGLGSSRRFLCSKAVRCCHIIAWIQTALGVISTAICIIVMVYLYSQFRMYGHEIEVKKAAQSKNTSSWMIPRLDEENQQSAVLEQLVRLIVPALICFYTVLAGLALVYANAKRKLSYFWAWVVFQVASIIYSLFWLDPENVAVTLGIVGIFIPVYVFFLFVVSVRIAEIREEEGSRGCTACVVSLFE